MEKEPERQPQQVLSRILSAPPNCIPWKSYITNVIDMKAQVSPSALMIRCARDGRNAIPAMLSQQCYPSKEERH